MRVCSCLYDQINYSNCRFTLHFVTSHLLSSSYHNFFSHLVVLRHIRVVCLRCFLFLIFSYLDVKFVILFVLSKRNMNDTLPYRLSYAVDKTKCQKCRHSIKQGALQIAIMIQVILIKVL